MRFVKKSFAYGDHTVTIETGEIARQAGGAVMVTMDDTVVLATVVGALNAKPGQDFFPADRRLPGKFLRRRPHPGRLLQARRPSFGKGNPDQPPDRPPDPPAVPGWLLQRSAGRLYRDVLQSRNRSGHPAMIGASAALAISGIPFSGPIGAARVGYIDGQYVLCPTKTQLQGAAS
jgi:polyribonucleotide nucleotidyltransferase